MTQPEGVAVYTHYHPCEARWHAFGTFLFGPTPETAQKATFHDWDRDRDAAVMRCTQLIQTFMRQKNIPAHQVRAVQPATHDGSVA